MVSLVKRDRKLVDEDKVFTQNAWDEVEWTQEMLDDAERRISKQKEESERLGIKLGDDESMKDRWNDFYGSHGDKFFKDRRWIFSEFQELTCFITSDSAACSILEVGCGVGNAVAHILKANTNKSFHAYCCDISSNAIDILKKRDFYQSSSSQFCGTVTAFQADICHDFNTIVTRFIAESSVDFIMLVFTLSALKPRSLQGAINNLASLLKPGGMVFFRDYAKNDLTQLRFKGKSYIAENYYQRADGTTSYFFDKSLVDNLFTSAGLKQVELKEDNRLLVNRLKEIKMCRRWIQAKYVRPAPS